MDDVTKDDTQDQISYAGEGGLGKLDKITIGLGLVLVVGYLLKKG